MSWTSVSRSIWLQSSEFCSWAHHTICACATCEWRWSWKAISSNWPCCLRARAPSTNMRVARPCKAEPCDSRSHRLTANGESKERESGRRCVAETRCLPTRMQVLTTTRSAPMKLAGLCHQCARTLRELVPISVAREVTSAVVWRSSCCSLL